MWAGSAPSGNLLFAWRTSCYTESRTQTAASWGRAGETESGEVADGRWQRRAARHAAERRRMPKHGKGYVTLTRQMIAQRAEAAVEGTVPATTPVRKRRAPRATAAPRGR